MELRSPCYLVRLVALLCLYCRSIYSDCHTNGECGCISRDQDGGYFPENPLSWNNFDDLIIEGQTLEYLEVYSLKPTGKSPQLSNVIYQWMKTTSGMYMASSAGLNVTSNACNNQVTEYERDETIRYHVRLNSVPNSQKIYVTTLISTCPSRYLILWMCPLDQLQGNYCNEGLEISIAAPHGPENMPWQHVSKDICRNNMPYFDDNRWSFTHTGPQCELPPTML